MTLGNLNDDKWIRRYHPSKDDNITPLVCFPHAGGSATYYFQLSKEMSPHVEVLALQYPGRQERSREPLVDNIPDLADMAFEALLPWSREYRRPIAFFGHSMGAILAFEVARRFQEQAEAGPLRLFASGRRAPSRYRAEGIHLRDDAGIAAELRKVGGTAARILSDPDVLEMVMPVVRNDYRAIEGYSYAPGPPLRCPVSVLVGDSDPQTSLDEAAAWKEHSTGEFDLNIFPGGHFYLEACRPEVIGTIRTILNGSPTHADRGSL